MVELSNAELECALNAAHTENAARAREIERLRAELELLNGPVPRLFAAGDHCLVCGEHHAGMSGLPCLKMTPGGRADG